MKRLHLVLLRVVVSTVDKALFVAGPLLLADDPTALAAYGAVASAVGLLTRSPAATQARRHGARIARLLRALAVATAVAGTVLLAGDAGRWPALLPLTLLPIWALRPFTGSLLSQALLQATDRDAQVATTGLYRALRGIGTGAAPLLAAAALQSVGYPALLAAHVGTYLGLAGLAGLATGVGPAHPQPGAARSAPAIGRGPLVFSHFALTACTSATGLWVVTSFAASPDALVGYLAASAAGGVVAGVLATLPSLKEAPAWSPYAVRLVAVLALAALCVVPGAWALGLAVGLGTSLYRVLLFGGIKRRLGAEALPAVANAEVAAELGGILGNVAGPALALAGPAGLALALAVDGAVVALGVRYNRAGRADGPRDPG